MAREAIEACLEEMATPAAAQFYEYNEELTTIKVKCPRITIKGVDILVKPQIEPYD